MVARSIHFLEQICTAADTVLCTENGKLEKSKWHARTNHQVLLFR